MVIKEERDGVTGRDLMAIIAILLIIAVAGFGLQAKDTQLNKQQALLDKMQGEYDNASVMLEKYRVPGVQLRCSYDLAFAEATRSVWDKVLTYHGVEIQFNKLPANLSILYDDCVKQAYKLEPVNATSPENYTVVNNTMALLRKDYK